MCGIAGIIGKNGEPPQLETLQDILCSLSHRGPDASGFKRLPHSVIGHTRLKILDLSDAANQPFSDGNDNLVFNGEIFNHLEIKKELKDNYEFSTHSDTEVLFRALQTWGERALDRLSGQFAFIFYQASLNRFIIARDHVGICPLYIYETDKHLYFSSEIKPILKLQGRRLNYSAVADYFFYRYNIQNGRTLFAGVKRFPPAHYMTIDMNTNKREIKRYWRFKFAQRIRPVRSIQEEFNEVFDGEIRLQKTADVPVGIYLSGGIDSGSILKGYSKTGANIDSYTIKFSDSDPDYHRVIRLEKKYRFNKHIIDFSLSGCMDAIEDAVYSLEEPFGDLLILPNYILPQIASRSIRVVLSGEGGDEAFCGYDHQRAYIKMLNIHKNMILGPLAGMFINNSPPWLLAYANSYPGVFGKAEKYKIENVYKNLSDPCKAYLSMICLFSDEDLNEILSDKVKKENGAKADTDPINEIFSNEEDVWRAVLRTEIEQLTLIVNLLKQDRFGMRFSLECRVPLVSRKILDFTGSLPVGEMFDRSNKKYLMNYSNNTGAKKEPFSLFSSESLASTLLIIWDKYVTRESVSEHDLLSWDGVEKIRRKLSSGSMIAIKQAMAIIIFQIWCKVFLERDY